MTQQEGASQEFAPLVDELGLILEECGYQRMAGRTLAQLMLGGLQSQADLSQALNASVAAISVALRQLIGIGQVARVTVRGEQRDYYRAVEDGWWDLMDAQSKAQRLRDFAERALESVPSQEDDSRRVLNAMHEFYAFWAREMPLLIQKFASARSVKEDENSRLTPALAPFEEE